MLTNEIIESLEESVQDLQVGLLMARLMIECEKLPAGIYAQRECANHVAAYIEQHAGDIKTLVPSLCHEIHAKAII